MPKQGTPKGWLVGKGQIDDWLSLASAQLARQEYDQAVRTCKRILQYLPKTEKVRAEVLGMIGMAYALQKKFEESYQILSEAVQLDPDDSSLLFNRGLSSRFTSRTGRSLQDFEKVALMKMDRQIAERIQEELELARKMVLSEMRLRGPDFTLEQLIAQQDLFQQGNQLSGAGKWQESEAAFRQSIAMGDCLPQPWGNLGTCLMMQDRFDEAESAYKRALEIDPGYALAKQNLEGLAHWREHPEEKPIYQITSPFKDVKTNLTLYRKN